MSPRPGHSVLPSFSPRTLRRAAPLALFAALALWAGWPLWGAAARAESTADPLLNAWILAWDHYAVFHRPFLFFHSDMFWPHPFTLAFGEHLVSEALLAFPFRLFTSHPAAIHNLSLMQGYFFCAAAAYALGLHVFRRILPATLCGLAYGFASYRIRQSLHLQLVHGEFLPLMVLGFERLLAGGRRRDWWLLCLASAGQWLASWYWAVFSFWCVAPYVAVRLWSRRRHLVPRRLVQVCSAFLVAGAFALPVAYPYLMLKTHNVMYRPSNLGESYQAHLSDFLIPPPRNPLFGGVSSLAARRAALGVERAVYPGLFVGFGAAAALALAWRRRRSRFPLRLWLAVALLLIAMAFGDSAVVTFCGGDYELVLPGSLLRWFPMAGQMRVPARWILPALLPLTLLAVHAWTRLARSRWRGARVLAGAACLLLLAESAPRPSPWVAVPAVRPAALKWLNRQPYPSPVMILPALHGHLLLEAAWLRQPILNGSNGYFPPNQASILTGIDKLFPVPGVIGWLRALGIRFVLLNRASAPLHLTGDPSADWPPSRFEKAIQALPADAKVMALGDYTIVDLGPPAADEEAAWQTYLRLDRGLLNFAQ